MSISLIPTNTTGKLYLGSVSSVYFLKKFDIKCVISLYPIEDKLPTDVKHFFYTCDDQPNNKARMNSILDDTSEDIHEYLTRGQNVLVHCFAGISRSATVVLDYLCTHKDSSIDWTVILTYNDLINWIRKHRQVVRPNYGFAKLLCEKHNISFHDWQINIHI